MKLRRNKSKWEVVGDGGHRYSSHKSKKEATAALELQAARNALGNGWDRLTERQRMILTMANEGRRQ